MLSRDEFNLLIILKDAKYINQRVMAERLEVSLGKVNSLLKKAKQNGWINSDNLITDLGMEALIPYKVSNAIIMAAGMSKRFAPLSYENPKGLLVVKGEVLIEREIRQLQEAGIYDITIVVGYMKEKFFYLEEKFGVKIVVNQDYYRYNNTSSLIRVTKELNNTYVCSSDNYFVDNVFEPYVYDSYYSAVYTDGETDEYCIKCNNKGRIIDVVIGGEDSWYMLGHVFFSRDFSEKFACILEQEYCLEEVKEHLWENLYIKHINELDMYIRKYSREKVLEFDSLDELRSFDSSYINNADSHILKNICNVLKCEIKDIIDIVAINAGLTNSTFRFSVKGKGYVYRHPGVGTEKYINRRCEADSMNVAYELGLDDTFIYMNSDEGWKISRYIDNARQLDYHNQSEVLKALSMMKRLHNANVKSKYEFNLWNKTEVFISQLKQNGSIDFDGFNQHYELMKSIREVVSNDGYATSCLCHNDCYCPNFLLDENNNMYLIDWEYSGNDDPASDIGTFVCCSDYSFDEALSILEKYNGSKDVDKNLLLHQLGYIALASYYWYIWALFQETRGNAMGEWLYKWYKNSKLYAKKVLELRMQSR